MIILWKRVIILNSLLIIVCDYFKLFLLSLLSVIIPSTRDPCQIYDYNILKCAELNSEKLSESDISRIVL